MFLIDTNVVSELMRRRPDPTVLNWFGSHSAAELYISAVAEAELRRGVAILPDGERRSQLVAAINAMIMEDFAGRVLPFDSRAAKTFAAIFAQRRAAGRPISFPDCQIAAIALANGATMATRNVGDFEGCGVDVINPWNSSNAD